MYFTQKIFGGEESHNTEKFFFLNSVGVVVLVGIRLHFWGNECGALPAAVSLGESEVG